mmetsp:Transcript_110440/g.154993  ORF Transcript_110440/g.154993 Transcript_110440/m.154993 type:complete len:237 (-) Transcript_110440:379-1089(-)
MHASIYNQPELDILTSPWLGLSFMNYKTLPLDRERHLSRLFFLHGLQNLERAHQGLVDRHHCTCVVELTAIVRSRENRDQLSFREELIPILHHLMCSNHQVEIMLAEESSDDVRTEGEGDATIIFGPAFQVCIGIRPQEVANQSGVRNVCRSGDPVDLPEVREFRRKPPVDTEDLFIDQSREGECVEYFAKKLPHLDVVPPLAIVVKAIDASDGGTFVISPQHEEVLGMLDLVNQK